MAKNSKKVKIFIISAILVVVALAGLVPAFLANYNTFSPNAPSVLDDGENIYISTSYNDNYAGYRFKFAGENSEIFIESQDNIIDADEVIAGGAELGKTYNISVCYLAKNAGNNSEFSEETEWLCQTYLASTSAQYDLNSNMLTWLEVENADYYRVYYNDADDENYIDTEDLQLDLAGFEGGERVMYVVACSNKSSCKSSAKSNMVEFDLKHYFSEFSSLSYDVQTHILTAENSELLEKLEILLDSKTYLNNKFEVEKSGDKYIYKIDLTAVYNGERIVGISPADIDEFNLYTGSAKTIEITA